MEPIDDVDRLVVRAVDEFDELSTLTDATWTALRGHFDEQQVLDLMFTVGVLPAACAVAVNALGIAARGPLRPVSR